MFRGFHEVNIVVETKVRINHHDTKRIHWWYHIGVEEFKNMFKTGDDMFTVDQIVAPSHLYTPVWKYLDGLGTVTIFICQGDLIIKRSGLNVPSNTLRRQGFFV